MHMFVMVKTVAAGAVCLHSKVSDITQGYIQMVFLSFCIQLVAVLQELTRWCSGLGPCGSLLLQGNSLPPN